MTYQNVVISKNTNLIDRIGLVIVGSMLLAITSQLCIPLQPVPITLQDATVIFLGIALGWRLAGSAVALYLLAGAIGFPVFAEWSYGLPVLFGPSGGYLLGFLPATIAVGWLMEHGWAKNIFGAFIAAAVGSAIIFVSGASLLAGYVGVANAYLLGVKPFLLVDAIKLLTLIWFAPKIWQKS